MRFPAHSAAAVLYSLFEKGESPQAHLALVDIRCAEDFFIV